MAPLITVTVHCPCCKEEFKGTGTTREEAREMAEEALQTHLDSEVC